MKIKIYKSSSVETNVDESFPLSNLSIDFHMYCQHEFIPKE